MRRVLPYLFLIALSVYFYSYSRQTREDIKVEYGHFKNEPFRISLENYKNRYICNDCEMMIKSYKNSAQVVSPKGNVYFFDDVGCMIRWLERQDFKKEAKIYVYANDTGGYIDGYLAWYVRDAPTPLGYGIAAYETSMGAIASAKTKALIEEQIGVFRVKKEDKEIYEYEQIRLFLLRGETLLNPMIKRELLVRQ